MQKRTSRVEVKAKPKMTGNLIYDFIISLATTSVERDGSPTASEQG